MPSIATDVTSRTASLTDTSWTQLGAAYGVGVSNVEIRVNVDFFAFSTDDGDAARWALSANFKRFNGGDLEQNGAVASLLSGVVDGKQADLGAALWDVAIDKSGTDLIFKAKAQADVSAGARIEVVYLVP